MADQVIIVGGGAAAFYAASSAREADPACRITVLRDEESYVRPMLTKLPLAGFRTDEHMLRFDRSIVCQTGRVEQIQPEARTVVCSGVRYGYDRLILATGASPFVPPIPGADGKQVFTLRTAEDLHRIARFALKCRDAVIIGGGVIGLEAAYQLSDFGLHVTVLETAPYLMPRLLDRDAAELLQSKINRFAVKTGVNVTNITDSTVEIANGEAVAAQMVILCCGNRANTELARRCGIAVGRGILVNDRMQTNLPDIFACGDCTQWQDGNTGLWPQAVEQGRVAGINAVGGTVSYRGSDTRLLMNGPEFALYAEGDFSGADRIETKATASCSPLELNPRCHTGICRTYERDGHPAGAFLLGNLGSMAELHRRLVEGKA